MCPNLHAHTSLLNTGQTSELARQVEEALGGFSRALLVC